MMYDGLGSLIRVGLSNKTAGLAASHVIKNGAVALSPWAIRCLPIPLMILMEVAPPLTKKYAIPYIASTIIPAIIKKGSVTRLLWTVITGR